MTILTGGQLSNAALVWTLRRKSSAMFGTAVAFGTIFRMLSIGKRRTADVKQSGQKEECGDEGARVMRMGKRSASGRETRGPFYDERVGRKPSIGTR